MRPARRHCALWAAICAAVDAVAGGEAQNAFCAVRPPGHHAECSAAMGFCLFNNAAVGAEHARHVHGMERVAVVDFDVHHGNGTQNHMFRFRDLFYASSHQWPCYPGTGMEHETGVFNNIVNVPLRPGQRLGGVPSRLRERILPALRNFDPGIDHHFRRIRCALPRSAGAAPPATDDFAWVTRELSRSPPSTAAAASSRP